MACERLHDENIQALFVPPPNGLKNEGCFFSQIFAFALKSEILRKARPRLVVAALSRLAGTLKAPVDKPPAAR
jgi:hypothetical protein